MTVMNCWLRSIVATAIAVAAVATVDSSPRGSCAHTARRDHPADGSAARRCVRRRGRGGSSHAGDGPARAPGRPVHPRVHRDATVLAVAGRAAHRPLSASHRGDGKHRRRGGAASAAGSPPAGMSAALDRSLPTLGQSLRRRRIRDGVLRQMAPRRHARRVRVRVARLRRSTIRRSPAASSSSCRSAPRTARASRCC